MGKSQETNNEDPAVPTELLELHVELENAEISPEEFKEVFGDGGVDH